MSILNEIIVKFNKNSKYLLYILIFVFLILYCYLATLPKSGDFWSLFSISKYVAQGNFDPYQYAIETGGIYYVMHPPVFYFIQGMWLKLGSIFSIINLDNTSTGDVALIQFWGMLPYLITLFSLVTISYFTLKNKWLCLLWFGTFSFVSVIVMGQTDIFVAFFIYLSLIFFLKSYNNEKYIWFLLLSFILLGISITMKTYGGLLFPIYLLFSFVIVHFQNKNNKLKTYGIIGFFALTFFLINILIWLPFREYFFSLMSDGESSWLFNFQIGPTVPKPYHIISIWFLGYLILLYNIFQKILLYPQEICENKKIFIYYIFACMAWFFISVYSHPQWWVILIPPILLVIDNFKTKLNYFFITLLSGLFWFFPMMWVKNIEITLKYYIPFIPITGNNTIILSTLIISTLLIWILDIGKVIYPDRNKIVDKNNTHIFTDIELGIAVIVCFILIYLLLIYLTY